MNLEKFLSMLLKNEQVDIKEYSKTIYYGTVMMVFARLNTGYYTVNNTKVEDGIMTIYVSKVLDMKILGEVVNVIDNYTDVVIQFGTADEVEDIYYEGLLNDINSMHFAKVYNNVVNCINEFEDKLFITISKEEVMF